MGTIHQLLTRLFLVAIVLAIASAPRHGFAQDDDDDEAPEQAQAAQIQRAFVYTEEHFNQWVFNNQGNADSVHNRYESLLALKIDFVDKAVGLTEVQKKKLLLAGRGDIKRFFDRVDEKRRRFLSVKRDQNNINEIFQEIQPLQVEMQGEHFGDGSFFAKTLARSLTDDQQAKFDKAMRERMQFRYRAKVELAVAILDNAVGFTADQRKKFVDLIVNETKAPKRFGQYDYYVVLYQAARIPEAKLKPIFDENQWKILSRQIEQGRGMGQFLRQNDFLAADDVDVKVNRIAPAKAARVAPALAK